MTEMSQLCVLSFWAAFSALAQQQPQDLPQLFVEAGPEQVQRLADVAFRRGNPPAGLQEDAMTRCQVEIFSEVPRREAGLKWKPGSDSCLSEAHVGEIRVRLSLKIQVFVPKGAPRVLKAHEEGHAEVCQQVFVKAAKSMATKTYRAFPSRFSWESAPGCSAVEMQRRAFLALKVLDAGFAAAAQDELMKILDEGRDRYDRQTQNGLSDSPAGRSATVRGQGRAAKEVIRMLFGPENEKGR